MGGDKAKSGAAGGDVGEELWIVGRVMENMDRRLGAKRESIRECALAYLCFCRVKRGEHSLYVVSVACLLPRDQRTRKLYMPPSIGDGAWFLTE